MDLGRLGRIRPRPLRSMLATMVKSRALRSWPSSLFGKAEYLGSVVRRDCNRGTCQASWLCLQHVDLSRDQTFADDFSIRMRLAREREVCGICENDTENYAQLQAR
jgi:hypothetical protein